MDADIVPPEVQTKGKAWPSAQASWSLTQAGNAHQTHQPCRGKADTEISLRLMSIQTQAVGAEIKTSLSKTWGLFLPFCPQASSDFIFPSSPCTYMPFFLHSSTFGSTHSEHLPPEADHLTSFLSCPKTPTSLVQVLLHIWLKSSSVPLLQGIFLLFIQLLTACNLCLAHIFLWPQKIHLLLFCLNSSTSIKIMRSCQIKSWALTAHLDPGDGMQEEPWASKDGRDMNKVLYTEDVSTPLDLFTVYTMRKWNPCST